jgi:hypothetical protein
LLPLLQETLLALVMAICFAVGFSVALISTQVPKHRAMFALTHAEAMLAQDGLRKVGSCGLRNQLVCADGLT